MIPAPLFHSKRIIWPSFCFGLLDLLKPDYLKGIDLDNKDSWGVDEWRAYSRYLEESGKSMIESLEKKLSETKTELIIQRTLASRDPKSSKFRKSLSDPETVKRLVKWSPLETTWLINPTEAIEVNPIQSTNDIVPSKPSLPAKTGLLSLLLGIPTQKRGRRKNEDRETIQYALQILQIQSEYEAEGKKKSYADILDEDIIEPLGWRKKAEIKSHRKTILNTIPKIKKSR